MQESYPRPRVVGVLAFSLGLLVLGLGLVVVTLAGPDPVWAVVGAGLLLALTGLTLAAGVLVRLRRPGPPPRVVAADGGSTLVIPRSGLTAAGNVSLAVAAAALPAGFALDVALAGSALGAALLALLTALLLSLPLFRLVGRWVPGGLTLDQDGVRQRRYGSRTRVAWGDVVSIGPLPPTHLVETTAAPVWVELGVREAEAAYTTPWFRNGRLPGPGQVALDLRDLGPHPALVHAALETWWRDPSTRPEIGTPASLRRLGVG